MLSALGLVVFWAGCKGGAAPPFSPDTRAPEGLRMAAQFQGHAPCQKGMKPPACDRLRVWLVLYVYKSNGAPAGYTLWMLQLGNNSKEGERETVKGRWREGRGTVAHPEAAVFELDAKAPEPFRRQWLVDGNTLLGVDEKGVVLGGDAGTVYVLAKVGP